MTQATDLRDIQERNLRALKLRPSIGQGTATTTVRVRAGLTCDIEDGGWKLVADEMPGDGGAGLGPDAGVYGRAALGACLADGYVAWAARLGVPIDALEVTVEADYDARGMYGIDESVPPGWTGMRYTTRISSPAPREEVERLVETADRYSPLLDDFRRPVEVKRTLVIDDGGPR